MDRADEILAYWFDGADDDAPLGLDSAPARRWFGKDEAVDREIRDRFEADHERAAAGTYRTWETSPRGRLALVVLLDQFPRNMYRGTPRTFATDAQALRLSVGALDAGLDEPLRLIERAFLCMPLMHAEDLAAQDRGVREFERLAALARERGSTHASFLVPSVDYARRHRDIVARFGRFPHRNAILGRASTPEELEFLRQPGSSF